MAKRSYGDFYTAVEKHLVRILLLVLLVFAGYKLIVIEAPNRHSPAVQPELPCASLKAEKPPQRPRKKKRKRHKLGTLPPCYPRRKCRY